MGERLDSIECATCGGRVAYAGKGRPPRYCSASCRRTGWALDRATARLDHGDPRPQVMRQTVTREQMRPPSSVGEWGQTLPQLTRHLRDTRGQNTGTVADYHRLAAELLTALSALRDTHGATVRWDQLTVHHADLLAQMAGSTPAPEPVAEPAGVSRQQRRAAERARRKHG
jgi:endogenous inhibitor of DNA gyrase (YacG/DUF329 family)